MKCSELRTRREAWQQELWWDRGAETDAVRAALSTVDATPLLNTPEISSHLAQCAGCRQEWEAIRTLHEAISAWREQVPPVDLASAVLLEFARPVPPTAPPAAPIRASVSAQALRETGPADVSGPPGLRRTGEIVRARRSLAASLAALAGLFALSAGLVTQPVPDRGAPVVLHGKPPLEATGPTAAGDENVQSLVRHAGTAYLALAQETAGAMRGITTLVVPDQSSAAKLSLDSVPALSTGLVNELETDFRPLSDSVGGVFDFLWNTAKITDKAAT